MLKRKEVDICEALPFDFVEEEGTTFALDDNTADGAVHRVPCRSVYGAVDDGHQGTSRY
ncbi:MAG: hypothetical protein GVY23_01140 [Spirochaetes bacterium]|nr:hypothetical protein [Spirochaetota bacterium]